MNYDSEFMKPICSLKKEQLIVIYIPDKKVKSSQFFR